jgi:GTP-binding protein
LGKVDVGLIGFPNVGKSTLLSVVTQARPKVADYHFTTLTPNLGVAQVDGDSFVLADIPGLIEGAAEGAGLGHNFLRHIERTRLLIHVLDISGSEGRDPLDDYDLINNELYQYSEKLALRPQIIAANKSELPGAEENLERLREMLSDENAQIFSISAVAHKGLTELMRAVKKKLDALPGEDPLSGETEEEFTPEEELSYSVEKLEDGLYIVDGTWVDRFIMTINFGDSESLKYFQRVLREKGIIDRLREIGAKDGDTVRFGEIEFDFID